MSWFLKIFMTLPEPSCGLELGSRESRFRSYINIELGSTESYPYCYD